MPHPRSPKARARLQAEASWPQLSPAIPSVILRLSAVYGPSRSAIHALLRDNARALARVRKSELSTSQLPVSRVHVHDVVSVITAVCGREYSRNEHGHNVSVYNVADDCPASRLHVLEYAAALLRIKCDDHGYELDGNDLSKGERLRDLFRTNKRVCNRKMKRHLLRTLMYPSYKEGLRAIAEAEGLVSRP